MNAPRTCIRAIFTKPPVSLRKPISRPLHATRPCNGRRRPHYPSLKASQLKQIEEQASQVKPYSEEEKAALRQRYTSEQMAAIEAGEAAIDPRDLVTQGAMRTDPWSLSYLDDMSRVIPVIDKAVDASDDNIDPNIRPKNESELAEALDNFFKRIGATDGTLGEHSEGQVEQTQDGHMRTADGGKQVNVELEWQKFLDDPRNFFHSERLESLFNMPTSLVPELPKMNDPNIRYEGEDDDPHLKRLMQQTGYTKDQIRRIRVKNLVSHRVVNQTRMGKIQSLYYLTIAGNGDGLLGIGEGKAAEDEDGRRQAMMNAIRNMKPIPRYENRTIFGDVTGKVAATELTLSARSPGFGLRCQHLIFEMARAAGITDLSARVTRSRNKMNTIKAAYQALMSQRLPEDIARARGRKLVDVRKVYYGGKVY